MLKSFSPLMCITNAILVIRDLISIIIMLFSTKIAVVVTISNSRFAVKTFIAEYFKESVD